VYAHFLRQSLLGLLSLMLVLPASMLHVCRCTRHAPSAIATTIAKSEMRPCCAKRAAAAERAPDSTSPKVTAKCCCDELRWSQTITQTPPSRAAISLAWSAAPAMNFVGAEQKSDWNSFRQASTEDLAPDDPVRISLGRWQV
jgi:hypothetical protein